MSDQCELKLNLIENEPFEMIEHNLSQISNIEGSDNVGIGNVTYSTQSRKVLQLLFYMYMLLFTSDILTIIMFVKLKIIFYFNNLFNNYYILIL